MRVDILRSGLLDKRRRRLEIVAAWMNSTSDTWLLSELKWIEKKILTVLKEPKDEKKRTTQRAAAYKRNARIRAEVPGGTAHKSPWTQEEDDLVINTEMTDEELAKKLGRSYSATQKRRNRLRRLGAIPARQHVCIEVQK